MATSVDERAGEKTQLCRFPRRNKETGSSEDLRVEVGLFDGKLLVGARIWYRGARPTEGDDGYRPSKVGISIREHELDQWIAALEGVRDQVKAAGRNTSPEKPTFRRDRNQAGGYGRYGQSNLREPRRRGPEKPVLLPTDDELDAAELARRQGTPPWEG